MPRTGHSDRGSGRLVKHDTRPYARDNFLALRRIEGKAAHAPAVIEVGGDAEMREQAPLLEDVTDAPSMRRHVDAALRIEQRGFVEDDVSAVRRDQSGDHAGERGLARAGRAEQRGHATRGVEARLHGEIAEPLNLVSVQ